MIRTLHSVLEASAGISSALLTSILCILWYECQTGNTHAYAVGHAQVRMDTT